MPAGHLGILAVRELKIRQRRSFVSQENEMLAITAIIRVKKGCETAMREALLDITPAVREQWFVVDDAGRADNIHRLRQTPAYSHLFFAPDGTALKTGASVSNPDYGATLEAIASVGAAGDPLLAEIISKLLTIETRGWFFQ